MFTDFLLTLLLEVILHFERVYEIIPLIRYFHFITLIIHNSISLYKPRN